MTIPPISSDPTRIGPYTIAARIDSGGQGVVYLGHAADDSPAAVKVLADAWAGDARQRERFAKELAAARRVAPFRTAAVLDADMDADMPYIAGEYVPGPTLRAAVRDEGPRTGPALDRLAIATVTALAAVHEAGVVHRDLKPGNVILGPDRPGGMVPTGSTPTGETVDSPPAESGSPPPKRNRPAPEPGRAPRTPRGQEWRSPPAPIRGRTATSTRTPPNAHRSIPPTVPGAKVRVTAPRVRRTPPIPGRRKAERTGRAAREPARRTPHRRPTPHPRTAT